MKRVSLLTCLIAFTVIQSICSAAGEKLTSTETDFFEKKVRPLLVQHCYQCHSTDAEKIKGELVLDSAEGVLAGGVTGPAIVPGKPEQSLLIKAVLWQDEDTQMPPKTKLSDEQIIVLVQWVKMGAPDPRHGSGGPKKPAGISVEDGRKFWAFVPVSQPTVPVVKDNGWPRGEIDRFVLAGLEGKGLKPVRDADPYALIRRVYFDLTGLPPTPADVDAFVKEIKREQAQTGVKYAAGSAAYVKLVDRLLASEQFGERWGRHWLDVVRFAESTGMTRNYPYPHAWRYRDYVIDSFNSDKPYDQFLMEQIAGDLLPAKAGDKYSDDRMIATGFLAMGPKDLNERNALQYTMDNVDEQIDVVSRSMLALTVSCARCHDHKFDPIPTADYYALAGIFRSTHILAGYTNKQGGGNKQVEGSLITLGDSTGDTKPVVIDDSDETAIQALKQQLAGVQAQIKKLEKNKASLKPAKAKGKDKNNDGKADKAEAREAVLAKQISDLRMQTNVIEAQIKAKAQTPAGKSKKSDKDTALAMGVREGKPVNSVIYLRGEIDKPAKSVDRGFLQVLSTPKSPAIPSNTSGRLELAQWIAAPANPLTSRVMVNRIWQHLMGQGIVRTVDNFGATGETPSDALLLDHLATRFATGVGDVTSNRQAKATPWSVKALIRDLVLSRTYQLSTAYDEANFNIDSDNRHFWRQNQRRLEVEAIRDAMLHVGGKLDLTRPVGSPVSKLPIGEINGAKKGGGSTGDLDANVRRSVYMPIVRSGLPGMYELFDFAEPSMVTGERDVTTVATQALFMMNSSFVIDRSREFSMKLAAIKGLDDASRIDMAYHMALGRPATSQERERALGFIHSQSKNKDGGWAAFCQALLASAEYRYLN